MKNNMIAVLKKCGSVVFSLLLIVCLLPVVVFAESTYIDIDSCTHVFSQNNIYKYYAVSSIPTRFVLIKNGNKLYYCFVSESSFTYIVNSGSYNQEYTCPVAPYYYTASSVQVDNDFFYVGSRNPGNYSVYNEFQAPVYDVISGKTVDQTAIYYTYGEGAVEPVEPVDWGILKSPGYSTSVAGSGEASVANIDTVTWSLPYDTNNNDISQNGVVDVRAVRGKWAGESAEALQGKDYTTFSLEQSGANLGTVPASQGSFTASWSNVMQALDMASLLLLLGHKITGDTWEKDGWIYQIRLRVPDDDYTGEWQTVYTATSTSVNSSDTIINSTTYNMEVNQAFTEITQVNNNTSITYTYLDTDINIENPDAGTEPEGGTNLWDILKELINGIFQLLATLGDIAKSIVNLVGDLLTGLLDLIRSLFLPQDIDVTVTNEFNDHTQTIKENTGLFGQAIEFESGLHNLFTNVEASEPVISWPALTWENETFVPAGSINLMQYVEGNEAQSVYQAFRVFISGIIFFALFKTILRKLKGVLNK